MRSTLQPTAADYGFPSPAADDIGTTTPDFGQGSLATSVSSPRWPTDLSTTLQPALLAPEPDIVGHEDIVTPELELQVPLSFDAVVGADVDPAPSDGLSLPSCLKTEPALRLPSFTSLGIAAPHSGLIPHRYPAQEDISRGDLRRTLPQAFDPETVASSSDPFASDDLREQLEILQRTDSTPLHTRASPLHSPIHHYVTTITPPDESGRITWEAITKVGTGPLKSPAVDAAMASFGVEEALPVGAVTTVSAAAAAAAAASANVTASPSTFSVHATGGGESSADGPRDGEASNRPSWLRPVIKVMLDNVKPFKRDTPIKVLSHALPTPSIEGHVFPTVIESLQDQTPTSPMCWINVFHALPGKFNLADLPRSPPSTPGPAIGGDDYFTSKVFDSAVRVVDYQENLQSLPQSPAPIVPPSSVDVSIVERYIPPSSVNEFSEMFNTKGPSILLDRLVELSPDDGTLIFIYPTRKGARTFTTDYLGPILEPLLRSIVVVNGFSADMGSSAGRMAAAASLPDFDIMRMRVQTLCTTLSQTSPRMEKFHRKQTTFSMVYAAKEEVTLDRSVWADMWWCKQEKPRLRETINRYFRKANGASDEKTPPMIIQELLDGVSTNLYRGEEPSSGVEVSVFVIKRSG